MNNFVVLQNKKFNVGNVTKQKINIGMAKKKPLKQKDIKEIVKKLSEKFVKEKDQEPKILVRGMNQLGVWTLKAYEEGIDEMFEDEEDYLSGRVKDKSTFQEFDQIEISLFS
jgi:hypothetical protein